MKRNLLYSLYASAALLLAQLHTNGQNTTPLYRPISKPASASPSSAGAQSPAGMQSSATSQSSTGMQSSARSQSSPAKQYNQGSQSNTVPGNRPMAQSNSGGSYENALGMRVEFGSKYGTFAGISGKHFFNEHDVAEAQLLFGDHITLLELEYQYHGNIENAPGLKWYVGFGAGYAFGSSGYESDFLIRPVFGLDYKINEVPLNFAFDWRPAFVVTHGTDFNAARFGFAIRYAF